MFVYLIIFLCVIVALLFAMKRASGVNYDMEVAMGEDDIEANVKSLAQALRDTQKVGVSPDIRKYAYNIKKAKRIIEQRLLDSKDIEDYEKWLYENYFVIKSRLKNSIYENFALLPHKNKQVRIVLVADFIVKTCNYKVTQGHIERVLSLFNSYTPLQYDEILALHDAIVFALLKKIAALAKKVKSARFFEEKAGKTFNEKYVGSDTYIYFYLKNKGTVDLRDKLKIKDVNTDNVNISYLSNLVKNSEFIGNAITSIREVSDINISKMIKSSLTFQSLESDSTFSMMDIGSKLAYMQAICDLSYYFKTSEKSVLDAAFALSKQYNEHFGAFLFEHNLRIKAFLKGIDLSNVKLKEGRLNQRTYIFCVFFLNTIACLALSLLAMKLHLMIITFLLLFLPMRRLSQYIVDKIFIAILPQRPVSRMNYETIPDNAKTMVVVSQYIAGEDDLRLAVKNIAKMASIESDKNLEFTLLIDYKAESQESVDTDIKMSDLLSSLLSKYTNINAFVRRRVFNGKNYSGYERKRGAIMDFNHCLVTDDKSKFSYIHNKDYTKPQYIVLLDADNEVLPKFFLNAINAIMHPMNKSYDLLAFKSTTNLTSLKTLYSKKFYYASGREEYGNYSGLYYNMCAREIFCGKGIYNLDSFYGKLNNVLPEKKVLSHDIIEGAILKTGVVAENIYEDAPQTFVAEEERRARWSKGDIQLLPFIKKKITNNNNSKIVIKKPVIYNYIMTVNAFDVLADMMAFVLLVLSFALGNYFLIIPAMVAILGVKFCDIFDVVSGVAEKVKLRYVLRRAGIVFYNLVYEFFMLPYRAVRGFMLFFNTVLKMLNKNANLLEWKTFSSSQKEKSFSKHIAMIAPASCVVVVLAGVFFSNYYILAYAILSLVAMISLHMFSREKERGLAISDASRDRLNKYALKSFDFFSKMSKIDNNFLIPDNVQILPKKKPCTYTSSTNLGFLLLSFVSAERLGIITKDEACERISKSWDTISKLETFEGNLYNWYNVSSLEVVGDKFVSSVDSANFLACAIVCRQFLLECKEYELAGKLKKFIENVDLSVFYSKEKGKFFIGIDKDLKPTPSVYDMLASESRLLAYLGVVDGVKISVWDMLSKECVHAGGTVLLSWSGTMFEYLMPQIFFEDIEGSLITQSCKNAVKTQIKTKCKGLFGVSESGYYKFDNSLNYQYSAFGIKQLALRNQFDRCIVSPYSSFLALPYADKKVVENLKLLEARGMVGEFGFYEAIDYTNGKNIVLSFMAHHQGMSLAMLANYLNKNCIRDLFLRDERIAGGICLLTAKQNEKYCVKKERSEFVYDKESRLEYAYEPKVGADYAFPRANVLSNGKYSVVYDENGCGFSKSNEIFINRFSKNIYKKDGIFAYFKENNEVYSPTFAPILDKSCEYKTFFNTGEIKFENVTKNVCEQIFVPYGFDGEVRKFTLSNGENKYKSIDFSIYGDMCLNYRGSDEAHKTFENLFIETIFDESLDAVIAHRRTRDNGEGLYCGFKVIGLKFTPETNKRNIIGRLGSAANIIWKNCAVCDAENEISDEKNFDLVNNNDNVSSISGVSVGDVLEPCFGGFAKIDLPPFSKCEFYVVITYANSKDMIKSQITQASSNDFIDYTQHYACIKSLSLSEKYLYDKRRAENCMQLLALQMYKPLDKETLKNIEKIENTELLAKYELSREIKTIFYRYSDKENLKIILDIFSYLNKLGFSLQMVIVFGEEKKPNGKLKFEVYEAMDKTEICGKICVLDCYIVNTEVIDALKNISFVQINGFVKMPKVFFDIKNQENTEKQLFDSYTVSDLPVEKCHFKSGNGWFTDDYSYITGEVGALPYSNVVCGEYGGFITTENGGGYTFFKNSRENKLTEFSNMPIEDGVSENVFVEENGEVWRINTIKNRNAVVKYDIGYVKFSGIEKGLLSEVESYICDKGKCRVYQVRIKNNSNEKRDLKVCLGLDFALSWRADRDYIYCDIVDELATAKNVLTGQHLFAKVYKDATISIKIKFDKANFFARTKEEISLNDSTKSNFNNPFLGLIAELKIDKNAENTVYFVFGGEKSSVRAFTNENASVKRENSLNFFNDINKIKFATANKWLDAMMNKWVLYQVASSRLNGRCGFYQTGGAIGFRDQLQDCLAFIYSDREYVREHILLCAKHQFEEGDVQHWWHPEYFGVRTAISDDKLFLGYVTFEYIKATGDTSILQEEVPFLKSPLLDKGQEARLETPSLTSYSATLLEHIKRAIDHSLRFGENGLLLIGSGDWNDALNEIGDDERGESVWLTMFAYLVIKKYIQFIEPEERLYYIDVTKKMKIAVNNTYENSRFKRAVTKEGVWLGADNSPKCNVDIISQAFAVISDISDIERQKTAVEYCKRMVDENVGLIKLLDPPFDKNFYCGYLSCYPKGIRENGGQYTHSAVWLIKAFAMLGEREYAYKLLKMISPASKCVDERLNGIYQGEPYVLPADIYTNKDNYGRCGWSWYTGSASWYYKVVLEDILGVSLENNCLVFRGKPPEELRETEMVFEYSKTKYHIVYKPNDGMRKLLLDGINISEGEELVLPLCGRKEEYEVAVLI